MLAWLRARVHVLVGVLLVYGVILVAPGGSHDLGRLGDWIDAHWAPRPLAWDVRLLEIAFALLAGVLAAAAFALVRDRLRGAQLARRHADLERETAQLRVDHGRLRDRLGDWVERSHPLTFRCDLEGRHVVLAERAEPGAPDDVVAELDELPEPAHRAALRTWIDSARSGRAPAEPLDVIVDDPRWGARWLELRLRLEGQPDTGEEVFGLARDVSARRQAEFESAAREAIEEAWRGGAPLETGLVELLRELAGGLACHYAELWWVDERFEVLRRGPAWHAQLPELEGFARRAESRTFGKGLGLAGRTWAEAAVVRLGDLTREVDPRCARLAESGPFRSGLGLPIRDGERVLGAVVLLAPDLDRRPAGDAHLDRIGSALGQLVNHKRAARALLDNEARKNAMLESALDCVITIDGEGRIVEFNPSAEKTFGWPRSQVLGRAMAELLVPDDHRPRHLEAFARCLEPGSSAFTGRRLESEGLRCDGRRFPIEISVTSIHVGESPRFTAYLRDITDRKELERLKDELVSTVSHELRTPLTSMRGFVELLLTREYPPAEQRRFLEIVDTEIKRLGKLIDEFLDLQRLESGMLEYELERLSLRSLIEEAKASFDHASEHHRYVLELPDHPLEVSADADRIRQLLRNLLSNATKYSPEGGTVTVAARRVGSDVRVEVRDEGIGMDAATRARLFTRFFRADSTATQRIGGTGLGLALVKEIVEAHGGRVGVESEVDKGSEFFFTLPLLDEDA